MIRERCSCGAEVESDEEDCRQIVKGWRKSHVCVRPVEQVSSAGFGVVEQAPNFVEPELHIGFRYGEEE